LCPFFRSDGKTSLRARAAAAATPLSPRDAPRARHRRLRETTRPLPGLGARLQLWVSLARTGQSKGVGFKTSDNAQQGQGEGGSCFMWTHRSIAHREFLDERARRRALETLFAHLSVLSTCRETRIALTTLSISRALSPLRALFPPFPRRSLQILAPPARSSSAAGRRASCPRTASAPANRPRQSRTRRA
jgi:hypothetical protein